MDHVLIKSLCQKLEIEFTTEVEVAASNIAKEIDLSDTLSIGRYGSSVHSHTDVGHKHNEAVTAVSNTITDLVRALEEADPSLALKRHKKGFLARFTGQDAVQKVAYLHAVEGIDRQLATVPARVERLEAIVRNLDTDFKALLDEQKQLKIHLIAGQAYLEGNPKAGTEGSNAYGLSSPRDRFSKRLQNLSVLLTSNGTTLHQIQLLRANSVNLIDRLHEISTVLVPSWRSHRMGLYVNDQNYAAISEATRAHEALIESLRAI